MSNHTTCQAASQDTFRGNCACCSSVPATSGQQEKSTITRLIGTMLGGALILNSYLAKLIFAETPELSEMVALVGALFLGGPLLVESARAIKIGRLRMTELAALAVLASFALGFYAESGLIAFFLYMGKLIESRTALGARAAIEGLIRLTPRTAHLVKNDGELEIQVTELRKDNIIRVRPGENVPADGVIIRGSTSLNEASITGESLPVDKGIDSLVFAGTENFTGVIDVKVTTVGEDTTLGKVRHLILEAERTRLPLMTIIDQNIQWYTPTVLMISGIIYFFTDSPTAAIAALVAACPCALVMATPTAMIAGISSAARLGILIKNVSHLESAGQLTAVAFDKTGTLTTGILEVSRLSPIAGVEGETLLQLAASAEMHSNHPVARALRTVCVQAKVMLTEPDTMEEITGKGVIATVGSDSLLVGRETWLTDQGISFQGFVSPERHEIDGFSTLFIARNGQCIGWIGLEDHARSEAKQANSELRALGIRNITMLTGDRWGTARRVATELGCTDVVAECLPEQKLELVESLKSRGFSVAVIGDGINDAPALAAGHLGIAMGAAGNDIAVNSASIALLNNDLRRLPFLIRLSRMVRRVVYQNLAFGVIFIIVGISLSAYEVLSPIGAAILHCFGSLPVIFNSARIVRHGEELH